jgi:tetratricopeptide (TPR) repeat protein
MLSHGGGDPGYRTEFYIIPEKRIGVIVMANCWEDPINPIAMNAINILLGIDEKDWFTFFQGKIWKSIREHKIVKTIHNIRKLIEEFGNDVFHPAVLNQLGNRLIDYDKLFEAAELFKLNIELYPSIYQLYNSLGRVYVELGQDDQAIDIYRKSLDIESDNQEAAEVLKKYNKDRNSLR